MFKNNKYKNLIISVAIIIGVILIGLKLADNMNIFTGILSKIVSLSMPFIYGIIIAYILSPVVGIFENKFKLKRNISISLTYALFVGLVVLLSVYGIPIIIDNIKSIAADIPSYIELAEKFIDNLMQKPEVTSFINSIGININIYDYIDKIGQIAVTTIEGSISTIVNLSSIIFNFVLGLLISIYVLIDKDRLLNGSKMFLKLIIKEKNTNRVIKFIKTYNKLIGTYIGIKAIDSLIIGILAFILLSFVNSKYTLLLAVIVGITNMIPYFGPFIGEVIGFLINVFVSPIHGIVVFLTLFMLQMFDGWYLDPKLVGDKVGVRPFWIIYAVVIGGGFFGPIGMLLASPTAAVIKIYYGRLLRKKNLIEEEKKAVDHKKEDNIEK